MKNKIQIAWILLILSAVAIVSISTVFFIQPGYGALIFNKYLRSWRSTYTEGIYFRIPFIENVYFYNIRKRKKIIPPTSAASKDLQTVRVELSFLFSPDPSKLIDIYRTLGQEEKYENELFPSIPEEIIKSVIATKTAEEIIQQRAEVSIKIKEALIERMKAYHIKIEEVALSQIDFSQAFNDAIEKKQVAQQNLQAEIFNKQAAITKAEGEAEAARIINESSKSSPAFLELRRIEAQKEIAKTLSNSANIIYLPSNTVLMTDVLNKK